MNDNNDTLDDRFRQWSSAQQPDEQELRQLTARITQEARRRRRTGEATTPAYGMLAMRSTAFAAITVILLCTAAILLRDRREPGSAVAGLTGGGAWAGIFERKAVDDRRLFDEMHRLFDDRLRWMADFNGNVSVGVDELPGGTDADTTPIAMRLVVVARHTGETTWRPVWSSDVLLRADERVQIAADGDDAGRMTLWAHSLADGNVAVEADLHLKAPMCIASVVDAVFADGVPTEIATLRSGGREYRVLQSVTML